MRKNILLTIAFTLVSTGVSYSKPIEKNKKVIVSDQIKRVNKKVDKLEDQTKRMLILIKQLLNKKKDKNLDFTKREIK